MNRFFVTLSMFAWACVAVATEADTDAEQKRRSPWGFVMMGVAQDQNEDRLSTHTLSPESQVAWDRFLAKHPGASAAQKLYVLRGLTGHCPLEVTKE